MNKKEFVELVMKKGGYETKKEAESAVNSFIAAIEEALATGKDVELVGFGKFETVIQKGREGKVPGTNKTYKTEDKRVPKFKPGKKLKELVASSK